jgi:uncharacterized protein (UPF0276 family)
MNSNLANLPQLGVGIGFREPFRSELFFNQDKVDFLEIVAEHYLDVTQSQQQELELLMAHFPIVPHAINLSIGSAEGIDEDYLQKLAKLINKINPPWWSEHLSFTRARGVEIGHLSPLPYTPEAVDVVCQNIEQIKRYIDVPLILENITYLLTIPGAQMTEAQFIGEVAERCDCGLLLDVTNLYTNSVNHDYDANQFLDQLPLERVIQLHFTGGFWHDGVLIDSHSHSTPSEVWRLMLEVLKRVTPKGMILERDENIPPFAELVGELAQARAIYNKSVTAIA